MQIKVTRYGGLMAQRPKTLTYEFEKLDPPARQALGSLLNGSVPAPRPGADAFTYAFELADGGVHKEIELAGSDVPDAVLKLLP